MIDNASPVVNCGKSRREVLTVRSVRQQDRPPASHCPSVALLAILPYRVPTTRIGRRKRSKWYIFTRLQESGTTPDEADRDTGAGRGSKKTERRRQRSGRNTARGLWPGCAAPDRAWNCWASLCEFRERQPASFAGRRPLPCPLRDWVGREEGPGGKSRRSFNSLR